LKNASASLVAEIAFRNFAVSRTPVSVRAYIFQDRMDG
jgi:hypothetical protein